MRQLLERLLAERESARTGAEAARRNQLASLTVMSHELRAPLHAIAGYIELMELEIHGALTADQRSDLAAIRHSQRHLASLITRALADAASDAGTAYRAPQPVPLDEVLSMCARLTAPRARRKRLDVRYLGSELGLRALADPEGMLQIMLNLVGNAIKFTAPGGHVTVEALAGGATIIVRVTDTGCGIEADQLEYIFQPFVQLNSVRTRPDEGTGLGLGISRDLARRMNGELTAHSIVGAGSTFIVTLPAAYP
ncbi:MAG TPA: HAMP domain-containing sensor histidine kinase [Gemmatimonadaceae bacterium]|nr:HAMP domain-containing sensor histidine kinase [Gemmatimonadaceae bacterium]